MLGWEMSPDQLGDDRPAIRGPVRNLYLTGHWTQPGGGITPVIVSAMQTAEAVTRGGDEGRGLGFVAGDRRPAPLAEVR
jgi:phytoene dehydrogenase-like protein